MLKHTNGNLTMSSDSPPLPPVEPAPAVAMPVPPALLGITFVMMLTGDYLLRATPFGINIALWGALLYWGAITAAVRCSPGAVPRAAWIFFGLAGAFMLLPALRDAASVKYLGLCASVVCFLYGITIAHGFRWTDVGLVEFLARGIDGIRFMLEWGLQSPVHFAPPAPDSTRADTIKGVLRGALLAVPFLAIFGYLFSSADPRFLQLPKFSFEDIAPHLIVLLATGLFTWVVVVAVATRSAQRSVRGFDHDSTLQLGAIEVTTATGLIASLFFVFGASQATYLYGGVEYLRNTQGLTAADYARQGFYEMVIAAGIALCVVYFFDWLTRNDTATRRRNLHWTLRSLLVLIVSLLVSAVHRMLIYVDLFGLTEARLQTLVIIGGLAALILWCEGTVLRNHRERFGAGMLAITLAGVVVFAALNPHARITRVNAARALEGKAFDVKHLSDLSQDAIPAACELWEKIQGGEQEPYAGMLMQYLAHTRSNIAARDWRSWNLGHHRAQAALKNFRVTESAR